MKYVYKIVAALGALSVIPLIIFLKNIYFRMSSTALAALLGIGQLLGNESITEAIQNNSGKIPSAMADTFSLYDLYDLVMSLGDITSNGDLDGKFDVIMAPAIASGIVLLLIAICAILTAIFAFAMKDNRKVIYTSIAGIGFSFMFKECFEGLVDPILEGKISFASLMETAWGGLIGNFEEIVLTTNFWFIPAVFGAVILWTVLYNYTLPDKEKRERKLMLGELDEE